MTTTTALVLIVALLLAAVAMYFFWRRTTLRKRFGPEYDRTVQASGNAMRAEAELEARAKRVGAYHIQPLSPDDGARFSTAWRQVQSRFVDDPDGAVREADRLVTDLMSTRGYPMTEFERRAADLSVDHPEVVSHYREAHQIASRQHEARGRVSTEDLRQAVMHYRALFEELLDVRGSRRRPA
jgi:hypothetical protein